MTVEMIATVMRLPLLLAAAALCFVLDGALNDKPADMICWGFVLAACVAFLIYATDTAFPEIVARAQKEGSND